MITIKNEEIQYLKVDSFLPKMRVKMGFTGSNVMGYEMILKAASPLAERLAEELSAAEGKELKMKMLNTEFVIHEYETNPVTLKVESIGEADSLNALNSAGLKV
ncbi:MAG: hypothetical protein GX949_01745 [Peptococcaceae bacterium]|mgnify:CR=1 FL=1|jgi:hypothetical protein|nr:hypothetical protein [Peptococcaceae bacterium]